MGYRLYIGKVSKEDHDKMQKMSETYLTEKYGDGECVGPYDMVEEVHGFGKYYEVNTEKYNHFFANKDLQERFSDYDFWAVDADFLLEIIEKERKEMQEWFTECKEKKYEELIHQFDRLATEWSGEYGLPYDLNLEKPHLVNSWKRDYAIFDLVRIYKTFDWDKDQLVYYGW